MSDPSPHPTREELSAYSLGQLPPERAVAIDSHISECQPCCETIVAISSDDTFVGLLKEARQLPTDQTADHAVSTTSSSCQDVPVQLAEHPRYEILGLIGKGGMGDVYKARHRKMERTVALKVINRRLVQKAEAVDRFHREVKAAAQLSHPNIVTAHDADQAGDFHFMVMEYVDGVDLSQTVKDRGALPAAEACDYIRQAAIGLQHAHQRGMVHRDIKPHNMMVTADGTVKILDFGLASLAPEAIANADIAEARSDLTAAGAIMGTPDFISPEQAEDARQADIRSDIYSLGATLYYLLSGRVPFADGSVMHKLKSHAHIEPDSLHALRDDVPVELVTIVTKMMAKDPHERIQTPAEVAEALEPFVKNTQPIKVREPRLQAQPGRRRIRWLPLTAVATIFFTAILASIVYYIQTNNGIVRVEVVDDSLAVDISGQTVTMRDGGNTPISIRAGEKKLHVRQLDSGFEFETDNFDVRRNGQIAFKVDLVEGEVVVSKDGKPFDQGKLSFTDHAAVSDGVDRPDLEMMLKAALFQAAGIPVDQWERIERDPIGAIAGIEGEPLSMVLLNLHPELVSKTNPAVLEDFRWTNGIPQASALSWKISSEKLLGKVSMLQRDRMSGLTYRRVADGGDPPKLIGSVRFDAPGLYAGKVEFVAEFEKNNALKVIEFTLPTYGMSVVRMADGSWKSQDLPSGINAYKRPFDYDLSLVPADAMEVYGYRPHQIRQDGRFNTMLSTIERQGRSSFMIDANLEQFLYVRWANEDRTSSQPLLVLTVLEGTAMEFAKEKLGVELNDTQSEATRWASYYPVIPTEQLRVPSKQFVRFVNDKTLILSSKESLDAHQIALKKRPNIDLLKIASSMPDSMLWVIGNTSATEFVDEIKFRFSESALATTLMTQIPIWEDTSHLALSLTLDDYPTLQLSAHALSAGRQKQITQTARAVPVTLANLLRVYGDGRGSVDADTIGKLIRALNDATITEPSDTETRITVALKEAEPHLFRTLNSYFDRLETAKSQAFKAASVNNLKQIGVAFTLFEDEHGYLPSVTTQLPGAKYPVSWRVAILKYLDGNLYNQYDVDEPWDSDQNKSLLQNLPDFYRHPSQQRGTTSTCYVTLVGKNTATGDGDATIRMLSDISDGPQQTILVTEGYTNIPWTKPEDLLFDHETTLPTRRPHQDGWNVLFADGSVHFFSAGTPIDILKSLITRDGDEVIKNENGVWTKERASDSTMPHSTSGEQKEADDTGQVPPGERDDKSANPGGVTKALADIVLERDFGGLKFQKCEIVSQPNNQRTPEVSGLMYVFYEDNAGEQISLLLQWFRDRRDLQSFLESPHRPDGFERGEFDDKPIWRIEDRAYSWTDNRNYLVTIAGNMIPKELVQAYLDAIPSRVADFYGAPEGTPAGQEQSPIVSQPAKLAGARAVADAIIEKRIDYYVFSHCQLTSLAGNKQTGRGRHARARVEYYDPSGGNTDGSVQEWDRTLHVTIDWFEKRSDLEAEFERLVAKFGDVQAARKHPTPSPPFMLRTRYKGDEHYFWTDGSRLITMRAQGSPMISADKTEAFLDKIPSIVTQSKTLEN